MESKQQPDSITPSPYSKTPPTHGSKKFAVIGMAVILFLLICGVVIIFILQQKAKNDALSRANALEKRIATLEAADNFAEKQVKKDQYQAIFLEGEQVYFGKITELTKDTIKLEDIYYLRGNGSVDRAGNTTAGSDVSLVKLGKELHGPEDVMIIERKNVSFWENIKSNSEVSKAIDDYKKAGN